MPRLKDALRTNLDGFGPAPDRPTLPPPTFMPGKGSFNPNPSIRCPLPPFNVDIDTLRQYDGDNGESPKRRIIPLPVATQVNGGGSSVVNQTIITSGGSSSGGGTLTAKSVVYLSPVLAPGDFDQQTITMAKSFQLILADANSPCEMRLYGSALGQAADVGRALDAPVPAEVFNDLITDLVLDTPPYDWSWQNRVGVNTDLPQDTHAFITVWNTATVPAQIQITITYLPLES